jgi:hypothetical protein
VGYLLISSGSVRKSYPCYGYPLSTTRPCRSYAERREGKREPKSAHDVEIVGVTVIYALAALIYLQVSLHGCAPADLPAVQELLFRWLLNFRFLPEHQPLGNLAWPICRMHGAHALAAAVLQRRGGESASTGEGQSVAEAGAGSHGAVVGAGERRSAEGEVAGMGLGEGHEGAGENDLLVRCTRMP